MNLDPALTSSSERKNRSLKVRDSKGTRSKSQGRDKSTGSIRRTVDLHSIRKDVQKRLSADPGQKSAAASSRSTAQTLLEESAGSSTDEGITSTQSTIKHSPPTRRRATSGGPGSPRDLPQPNMKSTTTSSSALFSSVPFRSNSSQTRWETAARLLAGHRKDYMERRAQLLADFEASLLDLEQNYQNLCLDVHQRYQDAAEDVHMPVRSLKAMLTTQRTPPALLRVPGFFDNDGEGEHLSLGTVSRAPVTSSIVVFDRSDVMIS